MRLVVTVPVRGVQPFGLGAARRNSNIEAQLQGRGWQDLNNAKDNLCSRMLLLAACCSCTSMLPLRYAASSLSGWMPRTVTVASGSPAPRVTGTPRRRRQPLLPDAVRARRQQEGVGAVGGAQG